MGPNLNEKENTASIVELSKYQRIGAGIAALLSLLALGSWPYGYYIFLRWAISVTAALLVYRAYLMNKTSWVIGGVVVLILWNPIAPVYLDRGTWSVLNVVAAAFFGLSLAHD